MNTQINLRLSENMLISAKDYADKHGYSNIQEFIKDSIREKLFGAKLTTEEMKLVKEIAAVSEKKGLYGTEKELFAKLGRKKKL